MRDRRLLVTLLWLVIVAACSAPAAVRPTIDAVRALGFACGDGQRDNVPSGLFQWHCRGAIGGTPSTVLIGGNDRGVSDITLVSDESTDPAIARAGFELLVRTLPPLSTRPTLVDALAGWSGEQRRTIVGGVAVTGECDATQCLVMVDPVDDVLRPLPLP
jgi:hypothetical protein